MLYGARPWAVAPHRGEVRPRGPESAAVDLPVVVVFVALAFPRGPGFPPRSGSKSSTESGVLAVTEALPRGGGVVLPPRGPESSGALLAGLAESLIALVAGLPPDSLVAFPLPCRGP